MSNILTWLYNSTGPALFTAIIRATDGRQDWLIGRSRDFATLYWLSRPMEELERRNNRAGQ